MTQLREIYRPIDEDLKTVETLLREVSEELRPWTGGAAETALHPAGKMLRPALLILSSRAAGGKSSVAAAAAAVELVHSAALLHDDVVDHADRRRGSPTANRELGRGLTIVLGNYLYSRAFSLLPKTDWVRRELSAATRVMCSGEALELSRRGNLDLSPGEYLHAAGRKTASLTSACCSIGALLAHAKNELIGPLASYGFLLGIAFQIRDDCLDMRGETGRTGKDCCKDFAEKNATLPLLLSLPLLAPSDTARLRSMFEDGEEVDSLWLSETVAGTGSIERSMELALDFAESAAKALMPLGESDAKESLRLLAYYCVNRDS